MTEVIEWLESDEGIEWSWNKHHPILNPWLLCLKDDDPDERSLFLIPLWVMLPEAMNIPVGRPTL